MRFGTSNTVNLFKNIFYSLYTACRKLVKLCVVKIFRLYLTQACEFEIKFMLFLE